MLIREGNISKVISLRWRILKCPLCIFSFFPWYLEDILPILWRFFVFVGALSLVTRMEQVILRISTPLVHYTYCLAVIMQVEYYNNRIFSRYFTEHSEVRMESSFLLLTNCVVPVVPVLAPVWCRVQTSASLFAHLLHPSATELGPQASCGRTTQFSDVVSLASSPGGI
jgi:hypothetical protein